MLDDDLIHTLLTSAGVLMEDTSARMVLNEGSVEDSVVALREIARDLTVIADALAVVRRRQESTG